RHVRQMIALRKAHPSLRQSRFYTGETNERGVPDIAWHGTTLRSPGFDDPQGRALACTIAGFEGGADLHVMMNMFWEPLDFEVPVDPQRTWHIVVDTFMRSPEETDRRKRWLGPSCTVQPRSIVILAGTLS